MAKTIAVAEGVRPAPDCSKLKNGPLSAWRRATFLKDVRSEMRKVVTPSRDEVQSTTIVVIATVLHLRLRTSPSWTTSSATASTCVFKHGWPSSNMIFRAPRKAEQTHGGNRDQPGSTSGRDRDPVDASNQLSPRRPKASTSPRRSTRTSSGTSSTPTPALSARFASRSRAASTLTTCRIASAAS